MLDVEAPFESKAEHDEAVAAGVLHYCPVCDGYEVSQKQVVVLGTGHHGVKEALFLRGFTDAVELICPFGPHSMSNDDRARLHDAKVALSDGPISRLRLEDGALHYANSGPTHFMQRWDANGGLRLRDC